jgi:hypothetical protein
LTTQDQKTSRENQATRARFIKRNCCKTHTPHHPQRKQ